jgi:hypothetical protein
MLGILASHLGLPFYSEHHVSEYISTLQKALLFDQENIDTEEQFDKAYEQFKGREDMLCVKDCSVKPTAIARTCNEKPGPKVTS